MSYPSPQFHLQLYFFPLVKPMHIPCILEVIVQLFKLESNSSDCLVILSFAYLVQIQIGVFTKRTPLKRVTDKRDSFFSLVSLNIHDYCF